MRKTTNVSWRHLIVIGLFLCGAVCAQAGTKHGPVGQYASYEGTAIMKCSNKNRSSP